MLKIARKIFFIFLATLSPLASLDNPSRTTKHLPVFAAQMPIVLLLALRADDLERLLVQKGSAKGSDPSVEDVTVYD